MKAFKRYFLMKPYGHLDIPDSEIRNGTHHVAMKDGRRFLHYKNMNPPREVKSIIPL